MKEEYKKGSRPLLYRSIVRNSGEGQYESLGLPQSLVIMSVDEHASILRSSLQSSVHHGRQPRPEERPMRTT